MFSWFNSQILLEKVTVLLEKVTVLLVKTATFPAIDLTSGSESLRDGGKPLAATWRGKLRDRLRWKCL
jgi:hypothetical protein